MVSAPDYTQRESSRRNVATRQYERKSFSLRLRDWTARSASDDRPLSLILISIDDYERISERLGERVSKACLQLVIETVTRSVQRVGMFTARLDWNEFGMILPATDTDSAWLLAETMVLSVRQLGLSHPVDAGRSITLSAGIATSNGRFDIDGSALWIVAEEALRQARAEGDRAATSEQPT